MLKKIIYAITCLIFIPQFIIGQSSEYIYVGTFSGEVDKGIYVYNFDRTRGILSLVQILGGMESPTYVELHPSGKFLYSVNRNSITENETWGSVSAYSIDRLTGKITHINDQPSYGNAPCHISIDSKGRLLFIANYGSGSIASYPIEEDGSLVPASKFIQHTGSSIAGERQQGPHAHSTVVSPNDDYLYAADLGIDKVKAYKIDYINNTMDPVPASDGIAEPGSGPRHMTISTDQKYLYLLQEMGHLVTVFSINLKNGALNPIQTISTLPKDYNESNFCADIHIDPSGKHLYASNRGHNSLAIYNINKKTGKLTLVDIEAVQGDWPRNFLIDPKGDFLFVANRNTNNVVVFKRDLSTGRIIPTGFEVSVPEPVCIKILEID